MKGAWTCVCRPKKKGISARLLARSPRLLLSPEGDAGRGEEQCGVRGTSLSQCEGLTAGTLVSARPQVAWAALCSAPAAAGPVGAPPAPLRTPHHPRPLVLTQKWYFGLPTYIKLTFTILNISFIGMIFNWYILLVFNKYHINEYHIAY